LSLLFTKHYAMKTLGGGGGVAELIQVFLTTPLYEYEWSVSFTHRQFYPRGKSPRIHWIGDWMGPREGLDDNGKWKFSTLLGLELRTLS
jgi:hypothetical protein